MGKLKFLKTDQDFAGLRLGKSFQSSNLKLRVRFRSDQNVPRFGFIVPKKVLPKVVDRNFIKRRIKSILAQTLPKLKVADIVFYPQSALVNKNFAELESEVKQLFEKAKLWKS